MTEHDSERRDVALRCDSNNRDSLLDAIAGLQSTDDPSLCSLADDLQKRLKWLDAEQTDPSPYRQSLVKASIDDVIVMDGISRYRCECLENRIAALESQLAATEKWQQEQALLIEALRARLDTLDSGSIYSVCRNESHEKIA